MALEEVIAYVKEHLRDGSDCPPLERGVADGAGDDGVKELLAVADGYRESTESRASLMRDKDRGLNAPKLVIGDGAPGTWSVVRDAFPRARRQACWVHKMASVVDALPKRLEPHATKLLHEVMAARGARTPALWQRSCAVRAVGGGTCPGGRP